MLRGFKSIRVVLLKQEEKKKYITYLACCGPTFPTSWAELAVIWKSAIAPDSIPNESLHFPEIKKKGFGLVYDFKNITRAPS